MVGNSSGFVCQLTSSAYSYIEHKYNPSTSIANINIYGGMTLNSITLELSESAVSVNLSTSKGYFPISYRQNIKLMKAEGQSSATFTASNQRIKLLPGAILEIGEGCTLSGKSLVVYSAFGDDSTFAGKSSASSRGVKYPQKPGAILQVNDGATLTMTNLAGNVYVDNGTINYTTNTITCYEAWNYGSSGKLNPAWTISDYLIINEIYQNVPISYRTSKQKLYVGFNTYQEYKNYLPVLNVIVDGNSYVISKNQKVLFFDSITSYTIDFVSNIYRVYYGNKAYYSKNLIVTYDSEHPYINGVNSTLSISNNNGGINEFNIQSLTITCTTPTVQGQYPLYIDSVINLVANLVDASKAYDTTVIWTSSNESIAIVDNSGHVTGVSLGHVTITATCDGVSNTIELDVIEEQDIPDLESIYITDNKGGTSLTIKGNADVGSGTTYPYNGGEYSNNSTVVVTVNLVPNTALYSSIKWTFNASAAGRQYVLDNTQTTEIIENQTSVTIHVASGSGASADGFSISCEVIALNGQKYTAVFKMAHKADACFTPDTLITLSDGQQKSIQDLTGSEKIMVWNFFTGKYEEQKISILVNHGEDNYDVLHTIYSDGTELKTIGEHGIFDYDLNKFVYLTESIVNDYIGHHFVKYNPDTKSYNLVTLEAAYSTVEYTSAYSITSAYTSNALAEGLLTVAPPADFYNWISMGDKLRYDMDTFQQDIETYGLYTYEDFKDYVTYEQFVEWNGAYLKIAVEKGYFTYEYIIELIKSYQEWFTNN